MLGSFSPFLCYSRAALITFLASPKQWTFLSDDAYSCHEQGCFVFLGLVGVSVNQKLFGRNAIRNHKSARSLIQMSRRDPSQWIHHLNFLKRQYVMRSNNALYQRAKPKQTAILTVLEDHRDDGMDSQIRQVPTIDHVPMVTDVTPQPETTTTNMTATPVSSPVSTVVALAVLKPPSSKTVSPPQTKVVSSAAESGTEMLEVPHVQVESDEAREARLERQWKELKVDLAELPDVYAKLSKIKLTGMLRTRLCMPDYLVTKIKS
ncbi:unnamed protein product [Oncorhynchus mykiss]|uniref:Uncharacterized protein n=1 Tax=Oncorhynchus mykiss TaxID=8022 RepID=A0A060ZHM7_ONCMY|nr:unnamed protein product [Oncorhynchus mykiss]